MIPPNTTKITLAEFKQLPKLLRFWQLTPENKWAVKLVGEHSPFFQTEVRISTHDYKEYVTVN